MERIKDLLMTNNKIKLLEILLVFFVAAVIILIFLKEGDENLIHNQIVLWAANVAMLLMVWLGLRIRGEGWDSLGLKAAKTGFKGLLKTFLLSLLVLVLALAGFILGSIIMANITGIPEPSDMSNYAFLKDNLGMLFLMLMGVYIVSSFGEEVIYRGFLINRFSEFSSDTKKVRLLAVLLSSIIFGLIHYSWGPMGMVQTFFMGLALGLCYIYLKKRLWPLVLAHAYMDTILLLQIYLASN